MTAPSTAALTTKTVDDFASSVYRRARASGPDFDHVASTVRALRKDLGYLHAEARDPESALNRPGASGQGAVYARQLTSILEDTDFALKQADTMLKKYGDAGDGQTRRDVDRQERDSKLDLVGRELASQRTKIDLFLDTVQLHTPTRNRKALEHASSHELERIKDKVDSVAARIFRHKAKHSPVDGSDQDTWKEFRTELEKEGFSSDVLKKNKVCCVVMSRPVPRSHITRRSSVPTFAKSSLTNSPETVRLPRSAASSPTVPNLLRIQHPTENPNTIIWRIRTQETWTPRSRHPYSQSTTPSRLW